MKKIFLAAAICTGALLWSPQLQAVKAIKWKKVGDWEIRVDQSLGNGCFLYGAYQRGTVFRFGFDQTRGGAYILMADADWSSLEHGKTYPLTFRFDQKPSWNGDARGKSIGKLVGLYAKIADAKFFSEFARSRGIYISYQGRKIANLTLRGSFAAVKELIRCQQELRSSRAAGASSKRDPFATSVPPQRVSDPFAR